MYIYMCVCVCLTLSLDHVKHFNRQVGFKNLSHIS